jgi:hypothetical protein
MRVPVSSKIGMWGIDMSSYPSGIYLVKYITKDNKWGMGKIVVNR